MTTTTTEALKIEKLQKTIETFEEMNAATSNLDARQSMRRTLHDLHWRLYRLQNAN